MLKLSFFGGAQEVTGANYLLESDNAKLLVDCGLFQCPKFCADRNGEPFAYDVKSADALLVTHAHIDHTGRIPKLAREGFGGKIYSTPPTKEFARVMLEDSLGVLEKEARRDNKTVFYGREDIEKAMSMWKTVDYGKEFNIGDFKVRFLNASHILGSAMVEVVHDGKKILFTGDLGNEPNPLLKPIDEVTDANYIIIESAYGDRGHKDVAGTQLELERAVEDTMKRNGVIIIPSFAMERTQKLLFHLNNLVENGRIPQIPAFMDSPLAIKLTEIYKKYSVCFNAQAKDIMLGDQDLFKFPGLKTTLTTEESKAINGVNPPKLIIAGAGMMHGGRILHHALRYLPGRGNMILFIGYQVASSTGRRIVDGAGQVKIFGKKVAVNCDVRTIGGYSAHADSEALLNLVDKNVDALQKVFVVQGEPKASLFLSQRIRDYIGIEAKAPHIGDSFTL